MMPFRAIKIAGIIAVIAALTSCGGRESSGKAILMVSISPLKYIVESITGDDFDVQVMVPDGTSPETYSPNPQQMIDIERASLVFTTGLIDFETELTKKIGKTLDSNNIIDISKNIALIKGACSHNTIHHSGHHGGIDPHIWTSPEQLKIISRNVYDAIIARHPDSVKYSVAYHDLLKELDKVSAEIRTKIASSGIRYFIIYHPALTYYARDYGIEQISLEDEGKEPSAIYMKEIALRGKTDKVEYILYQRQFSQATVKSLATDMGATPVAVDPLAEDIVAELLYITDIITRQ